jgi:hypothetical protein
MSIHEKLQHWLKHLPRRLMVMAGLGVVIAGAYWYFPPNTFHPFCTYDLTYRLNATIDVGGRQYSSQVVFQNSHSRRWIEVMNSAGCLPKYGTALPFRLADDRLILLRTGICPTAKNRLSRTDNFYHIPANDFTDAMAKRQTIDLAAYCSGIGKDQRPSWVLEEQWRRLGDGFVIDNAEHPKRWQKLLFGDTLLGSDDVIRIVSATAEAIDIWPTDNLDKDAPAVLRTHFKYKEWYESPESIVSFDRRRGNQMIYEAN